MRRGSQRLAAALGLAGIVLLGGCRVVPDADPEQPPVAVPTPEPEIGPTAFLAGVTPGPAISSLAFGPIDAANAQVAFARSCSTIQRREDQSGLTRGSDWAAACDAASNWQGTSREFLDTFFETAIVGPGEAFATGYFEPQIVGSRERRPGFDVPVYGVPGDLERCWRSDIPASERSGRAPLSRRTAEGDCVAFYDRTEIEEGALEGRGLEIGWAEDAVEFFFLQIQGSGQLISPEGDVMRIGYASQNGRGYTGIGGVMRERGLLGDGPGQYAPSMQGIMQYLRENPEDGRELMRLNESWVFFRELTGEGPLGSLGVPVTGYSTVAVDPKYVPYGAPVWLDLDRDEADGLWVAQDTGGAIKGPNRFDTFWGAGSEAREIAGGMTGRGAAVIFLPKGTLERLSQTDE